MFFAENLFHCLQNGKPTFFINSSKKKIVEAKSAGKHRLRFFHKKNVVPAFILVLMVHVQTKSLTKMDGFYEKLEFTNAAFESTQIDLNAMGCDTKKRLKGSRLWEHCFERSRELASVVRKMHCWVWKGAKNKRLQQKILKIFVNLGLPNHIIYNSSEKHFLNVWNDGRWHILG